MTEEEKPFVILRPETETRKGHIKLNPEARFWAKELGMTEREYGRYLLRRNKQNGES
jgi:hypothetical protein